MFRVQEDPDGRDPQAEDGVVHLELPPGLSCHHVAAVGPRATEQYLETSA